MPDHTPPGSTPARAIAVRGFSLGPYETNCYVVSAGRHAGCWIVDASFGPGPLIAAVRRAGLTPEMLILTHAHLDHIAGVNEVLGAFPGLPLAIHESEAHWPGDARANLSALLGFPVTCSPPTRTLRHDDRLTLGPTEWRVLHTPGHSPGGIALHCAAGGVALVGDSLFAGSIGRTDFPGSDHATLERSIRTHLYALPEETVVYPGHGPETTVGRERRSNPFVRPAG